MKMFKKIVFENEKDKQNFDKYIKLKGVYLHKQIYEILLELNFDEKVTYCELSSYIRYDKNLRELLYIYLATFEESIKAKLCRNFDVEKFKIFNRKNYKNLYNDLIINNRKENSNLYFGLQLELFQLLEVYENKFNINDTEKERLKFVRELRNNVMHHSLLLFGNSKSLKETEENIEILSNQLTALYLLLPEDYRSGFEKQINRLNYDENFNKKYLKKLCLGVMKNGICTKERS